MILSILIATLPERRAHLDKMKGYLGPLPEGVEIVSDDTPRHMTTGQKRNNLIDRAQGEWIVFVDDDDEVTPDYLPSIMEALKQNPDCVTFCGWYTDVKNNNYKLDWTIKLGESYEARNQDHKYQMFRWPNHLAVMRKSLIANVRFPHEWQGEDFQWSKAINNGYIGSDNVWRSGPKRLLKTEVHIPKQLYHYIYISGK